MEIIKIAGIAIMGLLLCAAVKESKKEFAIYITLATILIIFVFIFDKLSAVFTFTQAVYEGITYGKSFFPIIIKVLAIAYLTDFVARLCEDAGENAIAGKVELAGKVLIFFLAIPIFTSIISLINSIL